MVCIYCGSRTEVINSRLQKRPNQVWRRRKCLNCGAVISTQEMVLYENSLAVHGVNGKPQPFLRDKLFLSLYESCRHRPTSLTDAVALTATVIGQLRSHVRTGSVEYADIIRVALETLQNFDKAAAVHYKAYHPVS